MRIMKVLLVVLALVLCTAPLWAEEGAAPREQPVKHEEATQGTVTGILTGRGDNWISVKAEGAREAVRYMPPWRGGMPSEGGGPDKAILEAIKKLIVTNLVEVTWEMQENTRRIISVKMLTSDQKAGTVSGTVVAKGEAWIDVKPKDGPTERYMAKWVPGPLNAEGKPSGGGMDKDMMKAITALKIGSTVDVKWAADERKRLDTLTVTAEPPAPTPAPAPATEKPAGDGERK